MTSAGYVICETDKIKTVFPEYQKTLADLEKSAINLAQSRWPGVNYTGFKLNGDSFGRTTLLPALFAGWGQVPPANLATWRQNFLAVAGSEQTLLQGCAGGQITPEDVMICIGGFAIPDATINLTELRFSWSDRRHVRVNIEEMQAYETPSLVFEEGFVLPEKTFFLLQGYIEANGFQRIIPLGFVVYKTRDRVIGVTGSAIATT